MQYLRYIELQMDLKTNVDSLMLLHFLKIQFIFAIQIIRHVLNLHPWVKAKVSMLLIWDPFLQKTYFNITSFH